MLQKIQETMDFFGFSFFFDLIFFSCTAIVFVPLLIIIYPVVKWSRKVWVSFVKRKHPTCIVVESNSIRTILDHGRSQGIYTLLVQGTSFAENARSHLMRLSSTKRFLRMALTTKWGLYAWEDVEDFSVDNHLVNSPCSFKGRPITDSNIQEFVSDLVSKFLPQNQSPWQVYVINFMLHGEETKLCLVRAHHLLLTEEHMTLADFLPLKYSRERWACQENNSPFTNLYAEPSALPTLHQKLTESFSNYWNEFLCNNDPIERPEILKKQIELFQCFKIGVIVFASTLKEFTRQYKKSNTINVRDPWTIFHKEAQKRNFNLQIIFLSLLKSLNPVDAVCSAFSWCLYVVNFLTVRLFMLLLRELRALKSSQKHYYPDTLTSFLSLYVPLIFHASMEAINISAIVMSAPKMIFEELFLKHEPNRIQMFPQCGRKVVAWSEEIDTEILKRISAVTGATDTEILLVAIVASLKEFFKQSARPIPDDVLTTAKFVSQRALFVQNHEYRGIICLALPTRTPLFDDDLLEILQVIQRNVKEARETQSAIYAITAAEASSGLLSSCLPSVFLKILLNHLTTRYSVSLTHVDGDLPVEGVDSAIFWRPPQGTCSMSITLQRYGNSVRLGVMVDAMIGPQHSIITKAFPSKLEALATTVGVSRTSYGSSPSPEQITPSISPAR